MLEVSGFALLCIGCLSTGLCSIGSTTLRWFRSGEKKAGVFRPDLNLKTDIRANELPMIGGPAMILAIALISGLVSGLGGLKQQDKATLLALAGALLLFGAVGFSDDLAKYRGNQGLREISKFAGIFVISVAATIVMLITLRSVPDSFYLQLPLLGSLLLIPGLWGFFFSILSSGVATFTALATDFSDGLDGLCAGLLISPALGLALIAMHQHNSPALVAALGVAGAALGYLPWNLPSNWTAQNGMPRRARCLMGDSGSLSLGGLLGLVAVLLHCEFLWVILGGIFVLEGLSALIQARLLTPLFRRRLKMLRYEQSTVFVPHTEFPLPFRATPLHHHYDLLGVKRRKLIIAFWLVEVGFTLLGLATYFNALQLRSFWVSAAIGLALLIWQSGAWTKTYFLGWQDSQGEKRLALFLGYPYRFGSRPFYRIIEITEATNQAIRSPAEEILLYAPLSIFHARAALGYFCYRCDLQQAAIQHWERIPAANLALLPDIVALLASQREQIKIRE